jgi:hypothetical protein
VTTSAPNYWTCQCGVQVPMGCGHTCAHVGPVPTGPWPTEMLAAYEDQAKALRARVAQLEGLREAAHVAADKALDRVAQLEGALESALCDCGGSPHIGELPGEPIICKYLATLATPKEEAIK